MSDILDTARRMLAIAEKATPGTRAEDVFYSVNGSWKLTGWINASGDVPIVEYAGCGSHEANWPNDADKALVLAANPETVSAICRALIARTEALRELVEKLDAIHADEAYKSVWMINQLHVGPYRGPNYCAELEAARKALAEEP